MTTPQFNLDNSNLTVQFGQLKHWTQLNYSDFSPMDLIFTLLLVFSVAAAAAVTAAVGRTTDCKPTPLSPRLPAATVSGAVVETQTAHSEAVGSGAVVDKPSGPVETMTLAGKHYQCSICQKLFSSTSHLTQHVRTHTGERPYTCDICQRRFALKRNIARHMRVHTRENKPCECTDCDSKNRLHREKPFERKICGYQLAQCGNNTHHMRSHSGEKSYTSTVCVKRLGKLAEPGRRNFTRHHHSPDKPHAGEHCCKCNVDRFADRLCSAFYSFHTISQAVWHI